MAKSGHTEAEAASELSLSLFILLLPAGNLQKKKIRAKLFGYFV